jgi:hypothetical protein
MAYTDPEKARAYQREWRRNWRAENAEAYRESRRQLGATPEHKAKRKEQRRAAYAADVAVSRERARRAYFQGTYGMSLEDRDAMLDAQGGRCAICANETPKSGKGWHIDHCHATGKVRGILCRACNIALGLADDSPERLRAMAAYLERHRGELVKV